MNDLLPQKDRNRKNLHEINEEDSYKSDQTDADVTNQIKSTKNMNTKQITILLPSLNLTDNYESNTSEYVFLFSLFYLKIKNKELKIQIKKQEPLFA